MKVRNVSLSLLQSVAHCVGVRIDNHRYFGVRNREHNHRFVLRLSYGEDYARSHILPKYQRRSPTGRRVGAVCWHGHRDFFRALFTLAPEAIVGTARLGRVRYTSDTFERLYGPTGRANIGSQAHPCEYRQACDCHPGIPRCEQCGKEHWTFYGCLTPKR